MSEENTTEKQGRMESTVDLDALVGAELQATGAEIPDGSYGAVLFAFGKPFRLKQSEKFRKEGQPEFRDCFDLRFGLYDKDGNLAELTYLSGIPDGGKVNRRSNLFKALRAVGGETMIDKEGNFAKGVKLSSFLGKPCVLGVKKNKDEWPNIDSIAPPMAGVKVPSLDECKALLTSSQNVPF